MKKLITLTLILILAIHFKTEAQQAATKNYSGAVATKKEYKVVFQLNSDDDKVIRSTLKNIQNALNDERLQKKLKVELVVHGAGVAAFKKDAPYGPLLQELQNRGVLLAQCLNTLKERNIGKDELFPFISFVPSGNGELIILQQQGWAIIHP